MTKRTHIVIAEPSEIIRSGLIAVLQRAANLAIDIAEVVNIASIGEKIKSLSPDIIIINPAHLGLFLLRNCENIVRNCVSWLCKAP